MNLPADTMISLAHEELVQLAEEGRDVASLRADFARLQDADPDVRLAFATSLLDDTANLPFVPDWPYDEPSSLEEIRAARPSSRPSPSTIAPERLSDRLLGAWLGRCAGCMLGKPVEGQTRDNIERLLTAGGAWELDDYFPPLAAVPDGLHYQPPDSPLLRGNITCSERDDDTDYTLLALHILEENGPAFAQRDVAMQWLDHFPFHRVYTAERLAYRNLVWEIWPPASATYLNPYREWIGAQIRADGFGYCAAGNPELAATFAWRDASISHTRNGIYGEMFFAALIAAAMAAGDLHQAIAAASAEIPARSRLRECIDDCLAWSAEDRTWQATWDRINAKYGHYHPVHTINNAALVLLGLLHSGGDFGRAISIAVMGGWDTDCNGATAGSVMGALLGAEALPPKWTAPLSDTLRSDLVGMNESRISDLAARTARIVATIAEA
jgi:ADP-ribosylglycohydrolase